MKSGLTAENCRLFHLENDLKRHELEDFRSHFESCAHCRAHVEVERRSHRLYSDLAPYSAPAALRDQLRTISKLARNPSAEAAYLLIRYRLGFADSAH